MAFEVQFEWYSTPNSSLHLFSLTYLGLKSEEMNFFLLILFMRQVSCSQVRTKQWRKLPINNSLRQLVFRKSLRVVRSTISILFLIFVKKSLVFEKYEHSESTLSHLIGIQKYAYPSSFLNILDLFETNVDKLLSLSGRNYIEHPLVSWF